MIAAAKMQGGGTTFEITTIILRVAFIWMNLNIAVCHKRLNASAGKVVHAETTVAHAVLNGSQYYHQDWSHAAAHVIVPPLRIDHNTPGYLMGLLAKYVIFQDRVYWNCSYGALTASDCNYWWNFTLLLQWYTECCGIGAPSIQHQAESTGQGGFHEDTSWSGRCTGQDERDLGEGSGACSCIMHMWHQFHVLFIWKSKDQCSRPGVSNMHDHTQSIM